MASKQHHPYPTSQDEPLEKRQKAEESLSSNSTSDVHRVELNPADCGLDFDIDANGFQGSALHEKGFAYCWSGARANVGIKGGKYCFGCKIVCEQVVDMTDTPVDQRNVSRVGISRGDDSVGSLGETSHGFGFGGTGKFSNAGKFLEYGEKFGVGDIVVCAVDLEKKPLATVGFSKNGKWLGIAREFDAGSNGLGVVGTQVKKLPWESALFPHVLLKNVVVQLLFSISDGLSPIESYKPWNSAIEDGNAIFGPTFSRLEECEVLMMVGLPASGKTTWAEKWAKEHPEKRYVLLGTNLALDLMKVPGLLRKRNYGERFELLMDRATGIFNTLLARAAKTPRNYILDQTNVYKSARNRKLKSFVKYRKIAVVIFPMPDELKSRAAKRSEEMGKEVPADAVIEMLANYVLPTSKSMSSSTDSFDEVIFPELGREEAQSHLDEMKRALPTYNINIKHEFSPLSGERPAQSFPRPLVAKEEHITDFEGHGQTPLSNVLSSDYLRSSQAIPAYARPTFSSEHRPGTSDANLILFSKQAGETTQYRDYEDPAPPYHRDEISPYQTPSSTDAFLRPKLESSSPISPYGCSPTPPSYGGHGGHVHDPGTPQFVRRSAMTDQYDRMPHQTLYETMTPKKLKSSASSSFVRNKFVSAAAEDRFNAALATRNPIPERGFLEPRGRFAEIINSNKWAIFCETPQAAIIPIIREFYANAKEHDCERCFVRGKWVSFDRSVINDHYGLLDIEDDDFTIFYASTPSYPEIIQFLASPEARWKISNDDYINFPAAKMKSEAKAWHYFINGKLLPSTNNSEVTKERAALNYAIQQGYTINVGKIINRVIHRYLDSTTTGGFPFPSLIYSLCFNAGVQFQSSEEMLHPKPALTHQLIRTLNAVTTSSRSRPSLSQSSTSEQSMDQSILQQMALDRQENSKHWEKLWKRLARQERLLQGVVEWQRQHDIYADTCTASVNSMFQNWHLHSGPGESSIPARSWHHEQKFPGPLPANDDDDGARDDDADT